MTLEIPATVANTEEKPTSRSLAVGFVAEMRSVAMKLHTKEQAKEGEKTVTKPEERRVSVWEASVEGYLKFLVDSRIVFQTLEQIVDFPTYTDFKSTGLERSEKLSKDLEWFKGEGYVIPPPSSVGLTYAEYLTELSRNDPQAFICHFYNVYFAHSAGGRMIGKKVARSMLNSKELEFYKWDGDLSQLLQNVREKLNKAAETWTRDEKDHCLEETAKSFEHSGNILRLVMS